MSDPGVRLSVAVIVRDHERFVRGSLTSVIESLPASTPIHVVDTGSEDGSREIVAEVLSSRLATGQCSVTHLPRGSSSLDALQALIGTITTEYVAILSADDEFQRDYGDAVLQVLTSLEESDCPVILNTDLAVCDEELTQVSVARCRWTGSRWIDRRLLFAGNPGHGPGAVLHWPTFARSEVALRHSRCLIEDYVLWIEMCEHVRFVRLDRPLVRYRRHPGALSVQSSDKTYAWSLGYCAGVARSRAQSPLDKGLTTWMRKRWQNRISVEAHPDFSEGFRAGDVPR